MKKKLALFLMALCSVTLVNARVYAYMSTNNSYVDNVLTVSSDVALFENGIVVNPYLVPNDRRSDDDQTPSWYANGTDLVLELKSTAPAGTQFALDLSNAYWFFRNVTSRGPLATKDFDGKIGPSGDAIYPATYKLADGIYLPGNSDKNSVSLNEPIVSDSDSDTKYGVYYRGSRGGAEYKMEINRDAQTATVTLEEETNNQIRIPLVVRTIDMAKACSVTIYGGNTSTISDQTILFTRAIEFTVTPMPSATPTPTLTPTPTATPTPPPNTGLTPPAANNARSIIFSIGRPGYTVDGLAKQFDVAPYIDAEYNRAMVPIRFIAEALGATVNWDNDAKTDTVTLDGKNFVIKLGQPLPNALGLATLKNDRLFVPVRYVSEQSGAKVQWDPLSQTVTINR